MQLGLLIFAEIKRGFVELRRYPVQALTTFVLFYVIFMGLILGAQGISGLGNSPSIHDPIAAAIIGYIMYWFAMFAINDMAQQTFQEAQVGTLEQVYLSPWPFWVVLLARALVSMAINLVFIIPLLFAMMLSTGIWMDFHLVNTVPLIALTILGLLGVGYILSGAMLLLKRIGNGMTLLYIGLLFLALADFERQPKLLQMFAYSFPLTQGIRLLRSVTIYNELPAQNDLLGLLLSSVGYFVAGLFVYCQMENLAKRKGLLGQH